MESSVFIIKPEGMPFRTAIHAQIAGTGLRISRTTIRCLSESELRVVYPDLASDLWQATLKFMACGDCEIGVVEGQNAVEQLVAVTGQSVNPSECKLGTIRATFGKSIPEKFGSALYFKNAIHRSMDSREASRDLALFKEAGL